MKYNSISLLILVCAFFTCSVAFSQSTTKMPQTGGPMDPPQNADSEPQDDSTDVVEGEKCPALCVEPDKSPEELLDYSLRASSANPCNIKVINDMCNSLFGTYSSSNYDVCAKAICNSIGETACLAGQQGCNLVEACGGWLIGKWRQKFKRTLGRMCGYLDTHVF